MDWKQVIVGIVIGAIVGMAGTFFALQGRISKLEGIVDQLRSSSQQTASGELQTESKTLPSREPKVKPEELISVIQDQQRKNVKEIWGELAHQCFTDDDLARFVQNKRTEQITESLKRAPEFLDVVLAIRQMELSERKKLLVSADKPLRPTWAELGRISLKGRLKQGKRLKE